MMKRGVGTLTLAAALCAAALLMGSCSKLQNSIPTAVSPELKVHESGWGDTTSSGFHGRALKAAQYDLSSCVTCHGKSYSGGTSGKSCFACHASYPHVAGWTVGSPAASHGNYVKSKQWQNSECTVCHGSTYAGGTSGKSCFNCHPSYPHTVTFVPAGGHSPYIQANGYPLAQCQLCHGASYAGGPVTNLTCSRSGCHVDASGASKSPEACNTCHGIFSAPATSTITFAPPRGVHGDTLASYRGVGAHQIHLSGNGTISSLAVACSTCHTIPTSIFNAGHMDTPTPAAVLLAGLATKPSGGVTPSATYSPTALTCASTFCHGAWRLRKTDAPSDPYKFVFTDSVMSGASFAPVWNGGSLQKACGTCHGLPPTGHVVLAGTNCSDCHTGVVDNAGNIIDKTKHMNGKINVYGQEYSF